MKTPAMLRKVDSLGRIVIPSELRRSMDLKPGDEVQIIPESDRLVLKKFAPACVFCDGAEGLMTYEGKNICGKCIRIIKQV